MFHWSRSRSRSHSVGLVLGLEKFFGLVLVLVLTPLASFSFLFSQHSGLINIPATYQSWLKYVKRYSSGKIATKLRLNIS